MAATKTDLEKNPSTSQGTGSGSGPCRVILYNDDWHTFDQVIGQLMKALACSRELARAHTLNVHNLGRDVVFNGSREDCQGVVKVLREIRLQTEIDWD